MINCSILATGWSCGDFSAKYISFSPPPNEGGIAVYPIRKVYPIDNLEGMFQI
jgi:hypothetical protein